MKFGSCFNVQINRERQLTNWSTVYANIEGFICSTRIRNFTAVDSINVQTILTEIVPLIQRYVSLTTSTGEECCSTRSRRNCTSIRVVPPSLPNSRAAGMVNSFAKKGAKCCQMYNSTVCDVSCSIVLLTDGQPNIWETTDPQDN